MKKIVLAQIVVLFFSSGCSGNSATVRDGPEQTPDLDYRGSDCILIRTIRDYTPLDNRHLLIRGPGRQAYFVILTRPSADMRGALGFGVASRDGRFCPYGGDELVFGGFARERISAQSISRITAEQEAALLIRFGITEPANEQAPAPAEVKGAEVEELG